MQPNDALLLDFDSTLPPNAAPECLGEVTTPSGTLLVIDTGTLNLWSHDRVPLIEVGTLSNPRAEELANSAVDLMIEGPDAITAGQSFNRQWDPRFLYDIPAEGLPMMKSLFEQCVQGQGLTASLKEMAVRIPHRQRVDRAVEWGKGHGEVQYHGLTAPVVGGLPPDQAMKVYGVRMNHPDLQDRWRWVWLEVCSGMPTVKRQPVGHVAVDWARLMFADVDALGQWMHEEPLDGKGDFLFWGRDSSIAASATQAPQLAEGYGWLDLPLDEAAELGLKVEEIREQQRLKFITDFRPHSHHYFVMRQVRSERTGSGVIDVGGARMCVFMTSWGDGFYPVICDYGEKGQLLRVRIELGNLSGQETPA
ncbi:MAG: hypothetical protein ABI977_31160 [Acidobacteriota bacterium]